MKILAVGLVKNPQLERLRQEGSKLGVEVFGCYSKDITIFTRQGEFFSMARGIPLNTYDLIYFWTLGDKRWEWYTAGSYLKKKFKTVIVNKSTVKGGFGYTPTPSYTYLVQAENNLPYPDTAVIFTYESYLNIKEKFKFPIIVKESILHQGKGVYKADSESELKTILESKKVPYPFIIRKFIENDGDIRVFTIGYKAVGAMKRVPKIGEFRSNISLGGTGAIFDLKSNPKVKDLAETASRLTGVEVAGVDIIIDKKTSKPFILEVNDGPQFSGIENYTGINIARSMIEYFIELNARR